MSDKQLEQIKEALRKLEEKNKAPSKIGSVGYVWWVIMGFILPWIGILTAFILDKKEFGKRIGRTKPALIGFSPWLIGAAITWLGII